MTPEQRARRNDRLRERYATEPDYRARILEQQRQCRNKPEQKDKARDRARRWAAANRAHLRSKRQEWYEAEMRKPANREASRRRARTAKFLKYGLTEDQFRGLLLEQRGVCRICGGVNKGRRLDIDHDHATGIVRGLLCHACNVGLGYFRDRPDLLLAAIEYLDTALKEAA